VYDVILRGGQIVDGNGGEPYQNGGEPYQADIGIVDGKIVEIGELSDDAEQTIDVDGRVVSPGSSTSIRISMCRDFGTRRCRPLRCTA